jgi:glycosyltransferase involved in cell wall biosynthesis
MPELPYITVGCPCRDRATYLPHYLDCIKNSDYPLDKITILIVENDSKDNTLNILNTFKKENSHLFHKIKIESYNQNTPSDDRTSNIREQYTYLALSKLRNYWISQVKTDFAIFCDSDIMISKNIIKRLVSYNLDYVAGNIVNGYLYNPSNPYLYTNMLKFNGITYTHIVKYPNDTLLEVDFSGAIMCLSKKACKLGKFGYAKQGEDQIFCESLKKQGIKLFVDTGAKCTHCMSEELLDKYIKEGFFF